MPKTSTQPTRQEHLEWCKRRALACQQPEEMFASMASDLNKHEETRDHSALTLGTMLLFGGHLSDRDKMVKFIEGFN